jgi:hypothetical protein
MRISPLNLISTPLPVLNTLGLKLRVGLSSEDPMVTRHASEPYQAFLTIYSPEGVLLGRQSLGEIPPNRRRFIDVTALSKPMVPSLDHLCVVHRVPSRLLPPGSSVEEEIELEEEPDYSYFRSVVEYSYPGGGNGSVVYETPPRLNAGTGGSKSSNTLTFTCQIVMSEELDTYPIIIHYSTNPSYSRIASYSYSLYSMSGERVASDRVPLGPFSVKVLDIGRLVSREVVHRCRDPQDGLSAFTFVGYSEDAAMLVVVVNAAPALGAVAVEHTHPPQTYLFPLDPSYHRAVKTEAQAALRSMLPETRRA